MNAIKISLLILTIVEPFESCTIDVRQQVLTYHDPFLEDGHKSVQGCGYFMVVRILVYWDMRIFFRCVIAW